MMNRLWEFIQRNKKGIGLFLTGSYWSLMFNPAILTFLSQHPYINAFISSLTAGLMFAGILKSDKETKIFQMLKKAEETEVA